MTVGERIQLLRKKTGMSQIDFATKINVSKQTLYKYENNLITNIPSDKIEAVANLCHVSPAYLMGWEEPESQSSTILNKKDEKDIGPGGLDRRPGSFMRILRQRAGYTAGVHVLSGNDARSEANLRW